MLEVFVIEVADCGSKEVWEEPSTHDDNTPSMYGRVTPFDINLTRAKLSHSMNILWRLGKCCVR